MVHPACDIRLAMSDGAACKFKV
jgi:hypothetical protein